MATMEEKVLSGSTNGLGITLDDVNTGGAVTIHTAVAGTSNIDKIWLYATNTGASAVKLPIEWGETDINGNIEVTLDGEAGVILVVPGLPLRNGLLVKAFAGTADVISIHGFVHRITA